MYCGKNKDKLYRMKFPHFIPESKIDYVPNKEIVLSKLQLVNH